MQPEDELVAHVALGKFVRLDLFHEKPSTLRRHYRQMCSGRRRLLPNFQCLPFFGTATPVTRIPAQPYEVADAPPARYVGDIDDIEKELAVVTTHIHELFLRRAVNFYCFIARRGTCSRLAARSLWERFRLR